MAKTNFNLAIFIAIAKVLCFSFLLSLPYVQAIGTVFVMGNVYCNDTCNRRGKVPIKDAKLWLDCKDSETKKWKFSNKSVTDGDGLYVIAVASSKANFTKDLCEVRVDKNSLWKECNHEPKGGRFSARASLDYDIGKSEPALFIDDFEFSKEGSRC